MGFLPSSTQLLAGVVAVLSVRSGPLLIEDIRHSQINVCVVLPHPRRLQCLLPSTSRFQWSAPVASI